MPGSLLGYGTSNYSYDVYRTKTMHLLFLRPCIYQNKAQCYLSRLRLVLKNDLDYIVVVGASSHMMEDERTP